MSYLICICVGKPHVISVHSKPSRKGNNNSKFMCVISLNSSAVHSIAYALPLNKINGLVFAQTLASDILNLHDKLQSSEVNKQLTQFSLLYYELCSTSKHA